MDRVLVHKYLLVESQLCFRCHTRVHERNLVDLRVEAVCKLLLDLLQTDPTVVVRNDIYLIKARVLHILLPDPEAVVFGRLIVRYGYVCLWVIVIVWIHHKDWDV